MIVSTTTVVDLTSDIYINIMEYDVDNTGETDDTEKWELAEIDAIGKILYVPKGVYSKDRTYPESNTTFVFDGGAVINVVEDGIGSWQINNKENVYFYGNGATINAYSANRSSNLQIIGGSNCKIHDINFKGSGNLKDCIYIGLGNTPPRNIGIIGGSCKDALRNGISIVAGNGILIDGVEVSGSTGSPGAGIDIEANVYNVLSGVEIKNCEVHNNAGVGIVNVFGDNVHVHNNRVHNNGRQGIAAGAGGNQFDSTSFGNSINDVARPQDMRAISLFEDDGWITIESIAEYPISIGTVCLVLIRPNSGAIKPPSLNITRYLVNSIHPTENKIKLARAVNYSEFNDLSSGIGEGVLSDDIAISDFALICMNEGQSSNLRIDNNKVYNNNQLMTVGKEIDISTACDISVSQNIVYLQEGHSNIGITYSYANGVTIKENLVAGKIGIPSSLGIMGSSANNVKILYNKVSETSSEGIYPRNCLHGAIVKGNNLYNCGRVIGRAMKVYGGGGAVFADNTISQDGRCNAPYGVFVDGTVMSSIFRNNILINAGNSNANSLLVISSTNIKTDNILHDGSTE